MAIKYAGESLLPGQLGQFFVVLAFGSALLSFISYFFATKNKDDFSWQRIARSAFWINLISVVGIGSCLFYIIYSHQFEYYYAWSHSSRALPVYFIISSFWEGQEGSFWLWTFWEAVLGAVLVFKAKTWERPVMVSVMLCQTLLGLMLIGVEVFGQRIGSSPFILLRNALDLKEMAPVLFADPTNLSNYLNYIQDGEGLNPLLQNYWMVIHPPTLFLGFASMIVPFSFAFAGLWQGRHKEWMKAAMPWALFAAMVLGTGIIMGSFWAYEALNFGGFWAWDPVENASIIPWLTLIGGIHVMLAYRNSGHAYFTAAFLLLLSFVLVVYASYLTRSGVLGDTSVHAFTDLGMSWQLIIFNLIFLGLMIWVLVYSRKEMPISKKDEETYSREFWLFIGALFLVLACLHIIAFTSIPVVNKLFGTKIAPPVNIVAHYNQWQSGFAVIITLLTGVTQFLKYKRTDPRKFYASLVVSVIVAAVITAIVAYITGAYHNLVYILLTFAAIFSIVSNARILGDALKGKWKLAGSAVAHIGFGLLLIGGLVAAATNKIVSVNQSGDIPVAGFEDVEKPGDNLFLNEGVPANMGQYRITYVGDSVSGVDVFYKVNYERLDKSGKVTEKFQLQPKAQQNAKMGLIGTPSTRHYINRDIYTIITAANRIESLAGDGHDHADGQEEDPLKGYEEPVIHEVKVGDTISYRTGYMLIKGVNKAAKLENIPLGANDVLVGLTVEVHANDEKVYTAEPVLLIKEGRIYDFGKDVAQEGLKLRFSNIMPQKDRLELTVYQKPKPEKKWIVMKAIEFPYINFFWCGTIIMTVGFFMSILRRSKELNKKEA
ncbi:cytochrome c-type biogenesis protein CcmF [bacterium A37T11]|nr:cytochrome c-type biogenesis protein CcmF [bacterium A37T11]